MLTLINKSSLIEINSYSKENIGMKEKWIHIYERNMHH